MWYINKKIFETIILGGDLLLSRGALEIRAQYLSTSLESMWQRDKQNDTVLYLYWLRHFVVTKRLNHKGEECPNEELTPNVLCSNKVMLLFSMRVVMCNDVSQKNPNHSTYTIFWSWVHNKKFKDSLQWEDRKKKEGLRWGRGYV